MDRRNQNLLLKGEYTAYSMEELTLSDLIVPSWFRSDHQDAVGVSQRR